MICVHARQTKTSRGGESKPLTHTCDDCGLNFLDAKAVALTQPVTLGDLLEAKLPVDPVWLEKVTQQAGQQAKAAEVQRGATVGLGLEGVK